MNTEEFPIIVAFLKVELIEPESGWVDARGEGRERKGGMLVKGHRLPVLIWGSNTRYVITVNDNARSARPWRGEQISNVLAPERKKPQ